MRRILTALSCDEALEIETMSNDLEEDSSSVEEDDHHGRVRPSRARSVDSSGSSYSDIRSMADVTVLLGLGEGSEDA